MSDTVGTFNKVFGIGLSRTGTASLARALNQLGLPTVHFPGDDTTFRQLRAADFRLKILERCRAVCDTPVVPYYAQFDELYPNSRFILTVRSDRSAWLASVEKLWRSIDDMLTNPYTLFVNTAVYGTWEFSRQRFDWVYDNHLDAVRRYFAGRPDDLLELDICGGAGWDRLGSFLGVDVPDASFPHEDILRTTQ